MPLPHYPGNKIVVMSSSDVTVTIKNLLEKYSDDPELLEAIDEINTKWIYDLDTPQNRELVRVDLENTINRYIGQRRNKRIDNIIE